MNFSQSLTGCEANNVIDRIGRLSYKFAMENSRKLVSKTWRIPAEIAKLIEEKSANYRTESDFVRDLLRRALRVEVLKEGQIFVSLPKDAEKLFCENAK